MQAVPANRRHIGAKARRITANVKDSSLIGERRDQIVNAAIAVFLDRGFAAATMRDVGLRAGLSQGTLYNYVRTKEDTLYLVCDRAVTHYTEQIARAIDGATDPRERLTRAVRAVVRAQFDHRHNILIVLREAHLLDARSREAVRRRVDVFLDEIVAIVSAGLADAPRRRASARLLAEAVTYLPTLFAMRPWRLKDEGGSEKVIDGLVDILLAALRIEQPA
ncbi:MAG: TetR/AcrR family transcriptional regulator [Burkholderiales bacterium]|nr:TetR/AcrR family transcriptional regulator [Burkholderiales bacterium]